MRLRPILLAVSGCLLTLLISACAPAIELRNPAYLQDTSLIDDTPCGAPCWRDIIPGETSWTSALAKVQDDPTLQDVREEVSDETTELAASFQGRDGIPCCLIYSRDGDTVDQILLQLAPVLQLGQVIEKYGDPEYVTGSSVSADQGAIALYYPANQMVVYAFVAGQETGQLSATSEVFAVLYVRESDMTEVIRGGNFHLWDGYQPASAYINETFDITGVPTVEGGATDEAAATDEAVATAEATASDS